MGRDEALARVLGVLDRALRAGALAAADGSLHPIAPVAIDAETGAALRRWVVRECAAQTIEVGLGYAISALQICAGLIEVGRPGARHVAIDPFQHDRFAGCGLGALAEAGLAELVEHRAARSDVALPQLIAEGRRFDLAFVDGNHRFDSVFVDLYYLGQLVRPGGVILVHDYDLPGVRRAAAFFRTNLGWVIEGLGGDWAALRTASAPDTRHFTFFADF